MLFRSGFIRRQRFGGPLCGGAEPRRADEGASGSGAVLDGTDEDDAPDYAEAAEVIRFKKREAYYDRKVRAA